MRRGTLRDVSSTENAGNPAQQVPEPPTGSEAVAPEAGTTAAPTPGDAALADPTAESAAPEAPAAQPAVPQPPADAASGSDPAQWGRVDEDGTVYVRTAEGERAVGSWQAGDPAAGLGHYGRRDDGLGPEVSLL